MAGSLPIRGGDLVALLLYLGVVVGVGLWCTRKTTTTEDYFLANRALPGWVVGFSLLGSAISSVSFLAYPGKAFADNWAALAWGLTLPIAIIVGVAVIIPFYRSTRLVSLTPPRTT